MVYKVKYIGKPLCTVSLIIHHPYMQNNHDKLVNFLQQKPPYQTEILLSIFSKFIEYNYTEERDSWLLLLLSISFYHKEGRSMHFNQHNLVNAKEC